ncbi:excinuclease ATPase subunit [Zoogloeaceae bacterium G21618-S1]|nr:excinuclease ATPase subunit [Zoogloeaceae bacterium G21618-S1]
MSIYQKVVLIVLAALASQPVFARDTRHNFPIDEAMSASAAREQLDPEIKFFFGTQKHPKVVKRFGEWGTNKKTNAFGKDDKVACEWAFLSAMLSLQDRVRTEGGNAVVDIKSNYRSKESSSNETYECAAGAFVAGVALKGTVVQIRP